MKSKERSSYPISLSLVAFTALIFTIVSCQDYNSHSFDASKFAGTGCTPDQLAKPEFCNAYKILRTRCANCHSGYHNPWATESFRDEQAWIDSGLKVLGDTANSPIVYRLQGESGPNPNMPPDSNALSVSDRETIKTWVNTP